MFHLAFTCRPRTFPEFSKPQAWYPCGKIGRGWSPPEDGTRSVHLPWLGGSQIWPKPLTYLRADMPFLVGKKICTYQLTCLTKIVGILGWIHKSMYMEQSYDLLAEACLTKNILRSISTELRPRFCCSKPNWLLQEVTSFLAWLERVATT